MSPNTTASITLLGRILLSAIFVLSGVMKFLRWDDTAAYMTSHGLTAVSVLLPAAALLEIGGGLAVLFGLFTRPAAVALFLFLIPTTLLFHNFWAQSGMEQQNQMQHFLKNLAVMGGLLAFAAYGAGAWSLDALWGQPRLTTPAWPRAVRPTSG